MTLGNMHCTMSLVSVAYPLPRKEASGLWCRYRVERGRGAKPLSNARSAPDALMFELQHKEEKLAREEMPIFARTHDLLTWLLPITNHFPRAHRHTFTQRVLDAAFDLRDALELANLRRGKARAEQLGRADEALARLRTYLRLATRWQWLDGGQYQHVARMLTEIGKLLGGWVKATEPQSQTTRDSVQPV